jgi:hypothetical protein
MFEDFVDLGYNFYILNGKKEPSIKDIFDGLLIEMEHELKSCSKL